MFLPLAYVMVSNCNCYVFCHRASFKITPKTDDRACQNIGKIYFPERACSFCFTICCWLVPLLQDPVPTEHSHFNDFNRPTFLRGVALYFWQGQKSIVSTYSGENVCAHYTISTEINDKFRLEKCSWIQSPEVERELSFLFSHEKLISHIDNCSKMIF